MLTIPLQGRRTKCRYAYKQILVFLSAKREEMWLRSYELIIQSKDYNFTLLTTRDTKQFIKNEKWEWLCRNWPTSMSLYLREPDFHIKMGAARSSPPGATKQTPPRNWKLWWFCCLPERSDFFSFLSFLYHLTVKVTTRILSGSD